MKTLFVLLVGVFQASAQVPEEIPKTLVVRVNTETKEIQALHSQKPLPAEPVQFDEKEFAVVQADPLQPRHELDRDSSTASSRSGWSFGFNFSYGGGRGYYPVYPRYGVNVYGGYNNRGYGYPYIAPGYYRGGYSYYYRPYYNYYRPPYYYNYYRWRRY